MPRYATLVATCPDGQFSVAPAGRKAWVFPKVSCVLSKESGVLNADPSETVVVHDWAVATGIDHGSLSGSAELMSPNGMDVRICEVMPSRARAVRFCIKNRKLQKVQYSSAIFYRILHKIFLSNIYPILSKSAKNKNSTNIDNILILPTAAPSWTRGKN
jgi:hypothetical protein